MPNLLCIFLSLVSVCFNFSLHPHAVLCRDVAIGINKTHTTMGGKVFIRDTYELQIHFTFISHCLPLSNPMPKSSLLSISAHEIEMMCLTIPCVDKDKH